MKRALLLCSVLLAPVYGHGDARADRPADHVCPEAVPGATISVADTQRGIAVTLTTSEAANVAELRRRVSAMEQMHERHLVRGTEESEAGERPRRMAMHVIPGSATVEDVRDGARVVFEPEDAGNLDDLRTHVQVMVQMMRERGQSAAAAGDADECPMMQMMKGPEALQEDEEEGRPR